MPHFPKPFWRPKKKRWYVQLDGKHVNLGPDRALAFKRYHELMAERKNGRPKPTNGELVVSILDSFLAWVQKNRSAGSYDAYRQRIQSFVKFMDNSLTVENL